MPGIERGQRGKKIEETMDVGEWYKVSERSMRGMMGMTVLTVLALGLLKELDKVRLDTHSMVNGLMVCIRLEPLSRLWGNHDRRNKDQVSSYSECRKEKESGLHRVIRLKWWMTLYHCNVHLEIKETAMKANRSKLVVSLMTRLNYNRVHKEFLRHPDVLFIHRHYLVVW